MAAHKQRKFSSRGRSPGSESRQTDSSPIRATVALSEQYYVAVDRQLKSGFETYEAAEKAAKEIKKRYPNPQVTVFDAKKRSHTAIEQPTASTTRRDGEQLRENPAVGGRRGVGSENEANTPYRCWRLDLKLIL